MVVFMVDSVNDVINRLNTGSNIEIRRTGGIFKSRRVIIGSTSCSVKELVEGLKERINQTYNVEDLKSLKSKLIQISIIEKNKRDWPASLHHLFSTRDKEVNASIYHAETKIMIENS